MARLTSGRVKKTPQSGITSDRYQFLGLEQAEPDLGDPLVGPSSIAAKPAPAGTRYIPTAVAGQPGERYWLDAQQFFGASTPGSVTVFDEDVQVGAANSTYILKFVGDNVSVDAVGTAITQQTGIATIRISDNLTPTINTLTVSSGATFSGITTFNLSRHLNAIVYGTLEVDGPAWLDGGAEFGPRTFNKGRISISTDGYIGFGTRSNIRIGDSTTGADLTSGSDNVFIGDGAGRYNTIGSDNNFLGSSAGLANTSGSGNNFLGFLAGYQNQTGRFNNFFGSLAGCENSTGNYNNFFGYSAGAYNTSGCSNNFLGNNSGRCNSTGSHNTFIGRNAAFLNTIGCNNNFLGQCAGYQNTTGNFNNFFGCNTGINNSTGNSNNFIGKNAGRYNNSGSYNDFIGNFAGRCNTSGSYNVFLGAYSGLSQTASKKVIIGSGTTDGLFDAPDNTKSTQFAVGVRTDANSANYWLVGDENFNVGIGTTNPQAKVHIVGSGSTALLVDGDVRVVGILTVGSSSITFDGINNTVSIGTVRLADETGNANYSGIITASAFIGDGSNLSGVVTSLVGYATEGYVNNALVGYATEGYVTNSLVGYATEGYVTNSLVGYATEGYVTERATQWTTTDAGIHTLGSVGIGTTNPTQKLEVNGTIKVRNGDVEIPNGYAVVINGQNVITVNSLGSPITSSSLTTVGTLQRLEVGGNLSVTGVSTFFNSITGTISTSVRAQTIDIEANTLDDNTYYIPFEAGIGATSLYIDTSLSYNPGQNRLTTTDLHCSNINATGITTCVSVNLSNSITGSVAVSWGSSDSQVLYDGLSASEYRSVEYTIQATEGSRFQTIKIIALHDGTTVYKTEYGNIFSDGVIASFDVDISNGNIRLRATASTSNTVNYKVHFTAIKV
jgi:hypothetical protein